MFSATAKTSLEASDIQTDEDCEELDGFSFSADFLEKKTSRKTSSVKPPPSPRSPYLSSMNVNPRRAAVAAWRLPRAALGDTRRDTFGESSSARLTSLSNGHDASQTLRSECDVTPELLKQTLSMRKHKHLHSGSNGERTVCQNKKLSEEKSRRAKLKVRFCAEDRLRRWYQKADRTPPGLAVSTGDYRAKEDMYDEIIRLKKSLQAQKSDNHQMKAKLRRLEEDNAKREKQIEELLDPTKGSEYTRSLVDKKKEGSMVLNGLKQRILKLEQQCREKENALSKLQSELRTTNLEELKITVETYFEEIQRLKILLEAAEKSSRAESKCSQRQQKALSSTVRRLSASLKQLQQENTSLREELDTDSPAGGIKGYREWSKQRLLRRLLEVEKRLEDSKRQAQPAKSSDRLDQEVQATPNEILGFSMATEAVVSVGMMTEQGEEVSDLRERLSQLEKERAELQETLSSKEQEVDQLRARIQTLEDQPKCAQAELSSLSTTSPEDNEDTQATAGVEEGQQRDTGGEEEKGDEGDEQPGAEKKEREKAALVIQTNWREHRNRDFVMLQSALRGHLLRESQLKDLLKHTQNKSVGATNRGDAASPVEGELDVAALTMMQSAFRGHLTRCSLAIESSGFSVPSLMGNNLPTLVPRRARSTHTASRAGAASLHKDNEKQGEEEEEEDDDPGLGSGTHSSRVTPTTDQTNLHCTAESGGAAATDSDDSDDIIMSPSRPLRSREVLML